MIDDKEETTMENWTQDKLQEVINVKHASEAAKGRQAITCKYFIEAVENKKYGWFWDCPNGGVKCPYRHALPPNYVLKSEKKKTAEEEEYERTPLEEIIEQERKQLLNRTPVTIERFLAWKAARDKAKKEAQEKADEKRKSDIKSGKAQMSGREIFMQNPELFIDDDEAVTADDFKPEEDVQETILTVTGTSITAVKKKKAPEIETEKGKEKISDNPENTEEQTATEDNQISVDEINEFGIQLGATEDEINSTITFDAPVDESLFTEEADVLEEVLENENENENEFVNEEPNGEISEKYGENGAPED